MEIQQHRNKRIDFLKLGNAIDKPVHVYLNSLKIKYQHERDLIEENCRMDKLKNFDEKIGNTFATFYQQAENDVKTLLDAELKDYLVFKYDRYKNVNILSDRESEKRHDLKKRIYKDERILTKLKFFGGFLGDIVKKVSQNINNEYIY
jgi:hypothetical protein